MTAVSAAADILSPGAQLEQFGSALGDMASSLCEETDALFRRVFISKKDEHGNIKFYNIIDPETRETRRESVIPFIENIRTGDVQIDESTFRIALKCAELVVGVPFYAAIRMVWSAVKTPFEVSEICIDMLKQVGREIWSGRWEDCPGIIGRGVVQMAKSFGRGVFDIVKVPLFALGAELAALYGIFNPYEGRAIFAKIENAWLDGESHKKRNYLASCFQVRGNVNEPRVVIIRRSPLLEAMSPALAH